MTAVDIRSLPRVSDEVITSLLERLRRTLGDSNLTRADDRSIAAAHEALSNLEFALRELIGDELLVAESVTLVGPSFAGRRCILGKGACLGPFSYLKKNVALFEGVTIGHGVELNTSVAFERAKLSHTGFVGSSALGAESRLSYGFVTATRRLDGKAIEVRNGGGDILWTAGGTHHGAVVGAHVQIGVSASLMPGATLVPGSKVLPGAVVAGCFG